MRRIFTLMGLAALLAPASAVAQCANGEVEITVEVETDQYGYEVYWQLLPEGNPCDNNPIFIGGNASVGCSGGGAQAQTPGGYGNNTTVVEGPWCLLAGESTGLSPGMADEADLFAFSLCL